MDLGDERRGDEFEKGEIVAKEEEDGGFGEEQQESTPLNEELVCSHGEDGGGGGEEKEDELSDPTYDEEKSVAEADEAADGDGVCRTRLRLHKDTVCYLLFLLLLPLADVASDVAGAESLLASGRPVSVDSGLAVLGVTCGAAVLSTCLMARTLYWRGRLQEWGWARSTVVVAAGCVPGMTTMITFLLNKKYIFDPEDPRFLSEALMDGNGHAMTEAVFEAGPQFVLQVAVILRLGYATIFQVISVCLSLATLSLSFCKLYFTKLEEFHLALGPSVYRLQLVGTPKIYAPVAARTACRLACIAIVFAYLRIAGAAAAAFYGCLLAGAACFALTTVSYQRHKQRSWKQALEKVLLKPKEEAATAATTTSGRAYLWLNNIMALAFAGLASVPLALKTPDLEGQAEHPPVFLCFHSVSDDFEAFTWPEAPLVTLCRAQPCTPRQRLCHGEEEPGDLYLRLIWPCMLGFLLLHTLSNFVIYFCGKHELTRLRSKHQGDDEAAEDGQKALNVVV